MIKEINGLDITDITSQMKRRQGRYLALLLQDIEEILEEDEDKYQLVRKAVLDTVNDYTRSIFRVIFGEEVEGLSFR